MLVELGVRELRVRVCKKSSTAIQTEREVTEITGIMMGPLDYPATEGYGCLLMALEE